MKGIKMPKINFKGISSAIQMVGKLGKEHLPTILTVVGLIGMGAAVVTSIEAGKKAQEEINEAVEELELTNTSDEPVELTRKEKFKLTWKYFIAPVSIFVVSGVAIGFAHKITLTRLATMTAAYKLVKENRDSLKDKIIEKDGEKKLNEYEKAIKEETLSANPPSDFYNTGHGNTIFFDPLTGLYFVSDIWHVQRAIIHLIEGIKSDNYYELSDFRNDLDLPKAYCAQFFAFNYSDNRDLKIDHPEVLFDYNPVNAEDGDTRPCIWLDYINRLGPSYEFEQEIRTKTPY